ncbi:MAG TPA: hypothetical protein VLF87_00170, partial [Patescibacteria group bacterium]|nr:hypothetical protein [Patescibacteria group bacterium]
SFNPPAGPATAPLASDTDTPELPSSGTPDAAPASDSPAPSTDGIVATNSNDDGLLDLKQQALQQLSPLVGHLDQTPEEKFRTTMMMIQASDNHGLIKDAFEAAQKINDDKARAQALLDVINEINYFTQHQDQA